MKKKVLVNKLDYNSFFKECYFPRGCYDNCKEVCNKNLDTNKVSSYNKRYGELNILKLKKDRSFYYTKIDNRHKLNKTGSIFELFFNSKKKLLFYYKKMVVNEKVIQKVDRDKNKLIIIYNDGIYLFNLLKHYLGYNYIKLIFQIKHHCKECIVNPYKIKTGNYLSLKKYILRKEREYYVYNENFKNKNKKIKILIIVDAYSGNLSKMIKEEVIFNK